MNSSCLFLLFVAYARLRIIYCDIDFIQTKDLLYSAYPDLIFDYIKHTCLLSCFMLNCYVYFLLS